MFAKDGPVLNLDQRPARPRSPLKRARDFVCALCAVVFIVAGATSASAFDVQNALTQAAVAVANKDFARAVEIYSQGINQPLPNDQRAELLRYRAIAFDLALQPVRAEADLTAAIDLMPSQTLALRDRGFFYLDRDRIDQALKDFEAGERLAPKEAVFAYGQGRVWSARRHYSTAADSYSKAIALDPNTARYWLWRADAKTLSKDYRAALIDYEKALALGDLSRRETAQLRGGRGQANLSLNLFQEAVADFDDVLAYNANNTWALRVRGMAFEQLRMADRALADYERALSLRPEDRLLQERVQLLRGRR